MDFKERAREHQISFKEDVLKIPADRSPRRNLIRKDRDGIVHQKDVEVRSSLLDDDAIDGNGNYVIFYPGFRKEISEEVRRSGAARKGQMITNLLRSEHIPYNIFFPMRFDLEGTRILFNNYLGGNRIFSVKRIIIEYNPRGLRDGTAFDVYIEYQTPEKRLGGIGVEVKYTEKEYPIKEGSREWKKTLENGYIHIADNYRIPSLESGWFKPEAISDAPMPAKRREVCHVVANKYRQIWRNHLLGASMVLNNQLAEFTSLTVYPKGNNHFEKVLPKYKSEILTEKGKSTFSYITYEKLFSLMEVSFDTSVLPQLNDWIAYLRQRYIVR